MAGQQPLRPGQSSGLERFARSLGISDATSQKIASFFNAQGLVLHLSKLRTYLSLQAKAGTFARLLQTKFVIHQYRGRTFHAPTTPPQIPSFLASEISAVTGLDNYSAQPRHALQINLQGSRASRNGALDCSPGDQTLTTADVAGAYGYNALWQRGLHGENMAINLYQTDGNADGDTWTQVNDELQQIIDANTNNASAGGVVSMSLGMDEADMSSDDVNALDSSLRQLTQVEHMTVFVASGDCGAFADETFGDLSVSFPASDPRAVAVGGTSLSLNAQGMRTNEVTWLSFPNIFSCNNSWGSGGGNSSMFSRPNWQSANGVTNQYSHNDRQIPDVSAVADNLAVYFEGDWGSVGGTSAAVPIWAAAQALVNEDTIQRRGTFAYSPQFYYEVAGKSGGDNAYYDVTSGNNLYYPATAGWDFTTGLGTPNLASFDQAVSNMLATTNGSVT